MIAFGKPFLLHNHKDVSAVFNPPIPFLAIPISVLVSMPVRIIPIAVLGTITVAASAFRASPIAVPNNARANTKLCTRAVSSGWFYRLRLFRSQDC